MAVTQQYRVQAELGRSGRWWVIAVPDVSGAHTQVRRLAEAEEVARELISLMTNQPADSFSIEVDVLLPEDVRRDLDQSAKLREQAAHSQARAAQLTRHAARLLRERGLPLRDVGQALGVSIQRAKQLVDEAEKLAC